jgi:hypothetical protein
MKSNQLIAMLVGILFITTVVAGFLVFQYHSAHGKFQQIQVEFNNTRALIQNISADAVEYSKKNPAIDPLLKSFNLMPGNPAPSAPIGKPATK